MVSRINVVEWKQDQQFQLLKLMTYILYAFYHSAI